jgi:hypothetical protein
MRTSGDHIEDQATSPGCLEQIEVSAENSGTPGASGHAGERIGMERAVRREADGPGRLQRLQARLPICQASSPAVLSLYRRVKAKKNTASPLHPSGFHLSGMQRQHTAPDVQ